jgi:hypothetical protein
MRAKMPTVTPFFSTSSVWGVGGEGVSQNGGVAGVIQSQVDVAIEKRGQRVAAGKGRGQHFGGGIVAVVKFVVAEGGGIVAHLAEQPQLRGVVGVTELVQSTHGKIAGIQHQGPGLVESVDDAFDPGKAAGAIGIGIDVGVQVVRKDHVHAGRGLCRQSLVWQQRKDQQQAQKPGQEPFFHGRSPQIVSDTSIVPYFFRNVNQQQPFFLTGAV